MFDYRQVEENARDVAWFVLILLLLLLLCVMP